MEHPDGRKEDTAKTAAKEEADFIAAMQKGIADDLPTPKDWRTVGANMAVRAK